MNFSSRFKIFILAGSHSVNSVYNRVLTPVLPLIVMDFDLSYAQAGLIVTAYSVGNSLFQFPISFAADYTGRRRLVVISSLIVNALPVFFFGWAWSYSLLIFLVFLSGLGCSGFHPSAVAMVADVAKQRRGYAMGLFKAGGDFGSVFTPAIVGWLAVVLSSWRTAAQIFVLPGLVWAVLIWMVFPKETPIKRGPIGKEAKSTIWELVKNRALIFLLMVSSCRVMIGRGTMAFFPLLLAESFGYTTIGIGWVITIYYVFGTISSVIMGKLSDYFKNSSLIVVLLFFGTLSLVLMPIPDKIWGLFALMILLATTLGPSQGPILSVMAEMVDDKSRASSVGLLYTTNEIAGAISPFVGGLIAQAVGLRLSFLFYALISLLATGAGVMVYRLRERQLLAGG
ncbi:MAG: MFS transporter [Nitrospinaceae bacterium]|jgi:MFS transporter, FSR family, fosmidomycin resistance protein|nr:MFS transporter [Nitrospinaceae bacterium]MBT3433652.1 MFS transporter [Nitrospinaceae bacterium]MBT4093580.1 MFS transporter [Nitrospinaceae bacterium]MBT4431103.1 MFS transporter [Nitrospinaceae bacterium]MBT5369967.1 MFS transporter [Nitrospinaceae bacterium]